MFDVNMVIPAATPVGWTASSSGVTNVANPSFLSGVDGTNNGADTAQTGKFGYAWNFSGNDGNNSGAHDHVYANGLAGDTDAGATVRSISVWAKQNNNGNQDNDGWIMTWGDNSYGGSGLDDHLVIKDAWGNLEIGRYDNPNGQIIWQENYNDNGFTFLDHEWHHIVVTMGTEAKIYVDGTNIPSSGWTNNNDVTRWIDSDHDTFVIGSSAGHNVPDYINGKSFDGSIDQILIYDDELTQDEVTALYNYGDGVETPDPSGLAVHYDFEQTTGMLENVAPETFAVASGGQITIDVDTGIATYDNPTNADWKRKALTSALDESTCDSESPCGFKATAEINVSALGDVSTSRCIARRY